MYKLLIAGLACLSIVGGAALAQDATPEAMSVPENAVGGELASPRGIIFDEAGNLYVAEAGTGGDVPLVAEMPGVPPEEMPPVTVGMTGRISMITPDGTRTTVVPLPSVSGGAEALGAYRAYPQGDSLWVVMTEGPGFPLSDAIIEIDTQAMRIRNFISLYPYEQANNPDGTEEIYSNPGDIGWSSDGTLYIIDTGMNALLSWTEEAGLATLHAWTDGAVPTAIEFGSDDSIYVGFLGAGIAPGAARIEHWSAGAGELMHTYEGFTAITDILVDEQDNLYAVELVTEMGEMGPNPTSGRVSLVTQEATTPVAEGLTMPFGIAQSPDGRMFVSTGTVSFGAPIPGAVIEIPM
jgi:sugar lactone lactonase YvrE